MKYYTTLSQAISEHTPSKCPDRDGTKIVKHLLNKFPLATHAVLFVNQDFSSPEFGRWTVMAIGPNQTYKTTADVEGSWLNDLPSQRQYPIAYTDLKG